MCKLALIIYQGSHYFADRLRAYLSLNGADKSAPFSDKYALNLTVDGGNVYFETHLELIAADKVERMSSILVLRDQI
jgi:hypothetical protein